VLLDASRWLEQLLGTRHNCARPYLGERGGVWIGVDSPRA
jgi:hypothetical protein